ncbi:MAG: hypothetical protein Tsb0034_21600 [Ekhidna sp.]
MKRITGLMMVLSMAGYAYGQAMFKQLKGEFDVGFKLVEEWDSTRIYGEGFRPMQVAIWYPSNESFYPEMTIEEMIRVGVRSETLVADEAHAYGEITGFKNSGHINKETAAEYLATTLEVGLEISPADGSFPVVLYAPGSSAHWYDNYLLCQLLASNGYVVASVKSRSLKSPTMSINWIGVDSQVRDLEFALTKVYGLMGQRNIEGVNVIGRSWGAIAAVVFANENERITTSLVSLDGTLSYNAHLLFEDSPYPNADFVRKPLFLAVGKKRSESATPIDRKRYFEDVTYADAYQAEYEHMPHTAFGSYYLHFHYLLNKGMDPETAEKLTNGYSHYTKHLLTFLDFYNKKSTQPLSEVNTADFSIEFREQEKAPLPDYQDFGYEREVNGIAAAADLYYQTKALDSAYAKTELFNANFMNATAYQYLSKGRVDDAIMTLKVALDAFPEDPNLHDSIGEMYFHKEDWKRSLLHYKRSLELNPSNENASKMIERINRN